jgi:hypothetical protein
MIRFPFPYQIPHLILPAIPSSESILFSLKTISVPDGSGEKILQRPSPFGEEV